MGHFFLNCDDLLLIIQVHLVDTASYLSVISTQDF